MTLKEYRTLNQLTQSYMATKLKITQARYCRIENGVSVPGMEFVNKVIALTNGSVGYKELRPDIYEAVMGINNPVVAEAMAKVSA